MNTKTRFSLLLASSILAFSASPGWGGPPPNPTPSDANLNTAGGSDVLFNNTGIRNTGFGYRVLFDSTAGNDNTGIGSHALRSNLTGSSNTANGVSALRSNLTGSSNTANGVSALFNNTIGSVNTANGFEALFSNTTGSSNTANGVSALRSNLTGNSNTASGSEALFNNSNGYENTASGVWALRSNTSGFYNTASGSNALLSNLTGTHNTANGAFSLRASTNGIANTANGGWALRLLTNGSNNTASGYSALRNTTSGSNNLALGWNAGINLTTGNNNIYLGSNAGPLAAGSESATMRLGRSQTSAYIAGVYNRPTNNSATSLPVYIDSTGKLGTLKSSRRFKDDIHDMDDASRRLFELRPVTFHYKQPAVGGSQPLEYGLIAEEVAKVYPDLVVRGTDGQIETVQYHKLTPMLLNEVQHLNRSLQAEKDALKAEQSKNLAQAGLLRAQGEEIAGLKQQMVLVQAQARRMEALAVRLSRLEAKDPVGPVADARGIWKGR